MNLKIYKSWVPIQSSNTSENQMTNRGKHNTDIHLKMSVCMRVYVCIYVPVCAYGLFETQKSTK